MAEKYESGESDASREGSRNIYAFGLTALFNDTATEMAYWVLPAFLASIGAGPAQLGVIEGIAESVASFVQLFSGYFADRIPRRKPIVVAGYFAANAVKPLLALATSWWQVLAIRFTDRFAKGVRGAPRDVMVAESVPGSRIGSAYGLIQAMDSAGAVLGPLAALWLLRSHGLRIVFWAAAVPGFLCFAIALIGIKEVRKAKRPGDSAPTKPVPMLGGMSFSLPGAFYYVLARGNAFFSGQLQRYVSGAARAKRGHWGEVRSTTRPGLQHHVHAFFLAGRTPERSVFAARDCGRWVCGFRGGVFCVWIGAVSRSHLDRHGDLWTVLCANQSRLESVGSGDGFSRIPRPRSRHFCLRNQRGHAAGQLANRGTLEALRPARAVLSFGGDCGGGSDAIDRLSPAAQSGQSRVT